MGKIPANASDWAKLDDGSLASHLDILRRWVQSRRAMGRICEKAWLALKWSWAKDRPSVRPEVGFLSKDAREAVRIAEIELGEEFEWARNLVGEAEDGADDGDVERGMTGLEGGN
ncbi:hypothetical protein OEA41_005525 [Lepraria neglecta]|uniref:Uncharacterized protein n=1 Tax=Lepraria neglecta TaxID=209136 RepID=A0AAE0DFP7_9LECA|nr:hypothetical protein OEA41_005525 [Lepraria neglecta]